MSELNLLQPKSPPRTRYLSSALALGATSIVLLSAGCGVHGKPAESPPPSPSASTSQVAVPSSSPLASAPCELLNSSDRSELGLTSLGKPADIAGTPSCDWTEKNQFGMTLVVDQERPLAELAEARGTVKEFVIGSHDAARIMAKPRNGMCAVLLGFGDSGSVAIDVNNANFRDSSLACQRAQAAAEIIEPKLP